MKSNVITRKNIFLQLENFFEKSLDKREKIAYNNICRCGSYLTSRV